jgi:hypothetical protein
MSAAMAILKVCRYRDKYAVWGSRKHPGGEVVGVSEGMRVADSSSVNAYVLGEIIREVATASAERLPLEAYVYDQNEVPRVQATVADAAGAPTYKDIQRDGQRAQVAFFGDEYDVTPAAHIDGHDATLARHVATLRQPDNVTLGQAVLDALDKYEYNPDEE